MDENNVSAQGGSALGGENSHHYGCKQNSQSQIVGAIILAGALIAGAILLKGSDGSVPVVKNNVDNGTFQGRPVSVDEHILGNKNAKIVIVEYSDMECPFCKTFHNTMHEVLKNNNEVAWVYRHNPIPQLHPKATLEAKATECAWELGGNDAFWKYIDRVFEITPSNNGLANTELPKIAQYVGLDVTAFNTCLESDKFNEKVASDVNDANKAGARGTPSSFILFKGKLVNTIPGALQYDAVMQMIKDIK